MNAPVSMPLQSSLAVAEHEGAWPVAPSGEEHATAFGDLLALLGEAEMIDAPPQADGVALDDSAAEPVAQGPDDTPPWSAGMDQALWAALKTAGVGVQSLQYALAARDVQAAPPGSTGQALPNGAVAALPGTAAAAGAPDAQAAQVVQVPAPLSARAGDGALPHTPKEGAAAGVPAQAVTAPTPVAGRELSAGDTETVLKLPAERSDLWRRPLAQALGERLQFQAANGVEQARIRLDPPTLGRIEILLRQEGNQLKVQLTASHPDVVRQLHGMGDGLRQELSQRQGLQVSVHVGDPHSLADGRSPQQQRQQAGEPAEDTPGQALFSESPPGATAFTLG